MIIPRKPEGQVFAIIGKVPQETDCIQDYAETAMANDDWYGPYGRAWKQGRKWHTCYVRISRVTHEWEHHHNSFVDPWTDPDPDQCVESQ